MNATNKNIPVASQGSDDYLQTSVINQVVQRGRRLSLTLTSANDGNNDPCNPPLSGRKSVDSCKSAENEVDSSHGPVMEGHDVPMNDLVKSGSERSLTLNDSFTMRTDSCTLKSDTESSDGDLNPFSQKRGRSRFMESPRHGRRSSLPSFRLNGKGLNFISLFKTNRVRSSSQETGRRRSLFRGLNSKNVKNDAVAQQLKKRNGSITSVMKTDSNHSISSDALKLMLNEGSGENSGDFHGSRKSTASDGDVGRSRRIESKASHMEKSEGDHLRRKSESHVVRRMAKRDGTNKQAKSVGSVASRKSMESVNSRKSQKSAGSRKSDSSKSEGKPRRRKSKKRKSKIRKRDSNESNNPANLSGYEEGSSLSFGVKNIFENPQERSIVHEARRNSITYSMNTHFVSNVPTKARRSSITYSSETPQRRGTMNLNTANPRRMSLTGNAPPMQRRNSLTYDNDIHHARPRSARAAVLSYNTDSSENNSSAVRGGLKSPKSWRDPFKGDGKKTDRRSRSRDDAKRERPRSETVKKTVVRKVSNSSQENKNWDHDDEKGLEVFDPEQGAMMDEAAEHLRIGHELWRDNRLDEAIKEFCKSLILRDEVVGQYHPESASLYWSMGNCYYSKGEYVNALMAHHRWLRIRRHLNKDASKPAITWIEGALQKNGLSREDIRTYDAHLRASIAKELEADELRSSRELEAAIVKYKESITLEKKCFELVTKESDD